MSGSLLSVSLDILVLIFLGVTIYYAIKLTNSLNSFRQVRHEFTTIMRTLSKDIDDAQQAVQQLKSVSRDSGLGLQKVINESRKIAGELEVINQAGNNAADRLEALIEQGQNFVRGLEDSSYEAPAPEYSVAVEEYFDKPPVFAIQDRGYEEEEDLPPEMPLEDEAEEESPGLQSQAERDLFEALQRTRKAYGQGKF